MVLCAYDDCVNRVVPIATSLKSVLIVGCAFPLQRTMFAAFD
jgi:hypothetical protein